MSANHIGNLKPFLAENAVREPAVMIKLFALDASLERLEKSLIGLGNRLTQVLSPETPSPASDEKTPPEACPLAESIEARVRHAEYLRSMVEGYVSRLEV